MKLKVQTPDALTLQKEKEKENGGVAEGGVIRTSAHFLRPPLATPNRDTFFLLSRHDT